MNVSHQKRIESYPVYQTYPIKGNIPIKNMTNSKVDEKIDHFLASTLKKKPYPSSYVGISNFYGSNNLSSPENYHLQGFRENPPVLMKPPIQIERSYMSPGMGLPRLPQVEVQKQKQMVEKNLKTVKKKKESKSKICSLLPWLIGALLLLALIALIVLLIVCKAHKNTQVSTKTLYITPPIKIQQNLNKQSIQPTQICPNHSKPCPLPLTYRKQTLKLYTNPQPVFQKQKDFSTDAKPLMPAAGVSQSPQQAFNQIDHTNYGFVHLRRNYG